MNQYQRMICYLYEYNKGQKGANVGYVRLEQRGDRCRVQIQMRGRNLEKPPIAAFFKQEDTGVRLLKIREMQEGKGELFCRVESRVDNLLERGRTLKEMDGIFLYVSDVLHFASTWKLQDIYAGKVNWWEEDEKGMEGSAPVQPVGRDAGSVRKSKESSMASGLGENTWESKEASENTESEESSKRLPGTDNVENSEDGEFVPKANYPWGNNHQGQFARQEEEIAAAKTDPTMHTTTQNRTKDDFKGRQFMPEKELSVAELEEQIVCERCPFKRKELDYGKKMLITFPVMRPFGNGYRGKCVRIEPQDLGCLPMKLWPLSGNSFLMQGYYNYRHLIFMEWEQSSYAIGVPGIYSETVKEKGETAGFTEFMAICGQRNCRGAFGYWLMPLSVR